MGKIVLPFSLDPLDPKLVVPKPQEEFEESDIIALESCGKLSKTRKRHGYCTPLTITGPRRKVTLYTRGINDNTARFPHIVEAFRDSMIPTDSLCFGELFFADSVSDLKRFGVFTSINKSSVEKAIALQKAVGLAQYMMFSPLVVGRRDVMNVGFLDRWQMMAEWADKRSSIPEVSHVELLKGSFEELKRIVVCDDWEGLVLYAPDGKLSYRLDGNIDKPPRMEGAWKWKPKFEGDFIVRRFGWGSGKNADRMGKLYLSQIDPTTGEEVACGEVASGFSRDKKLEFAKATYPLVVEVEYEARTPSGALTGGLFLRERDDKGVDGCFLPKQLHGLSQKKKKK